VKNRPPEEDGLKNFAWPKRLHNLVGIEPAKYADIISFKR
jgi:hypothetical protein